MAIAELKTSALLNQNASEENVCPECGTDLESGICPECDTDGTEEDEIENLSDEFDE